LFYYSIYIQLKIVTNPKLNSSQTENTFIDDSGLNRFKLKEIVSDFLTNIPKSPNPDENPLLEQKKYD